MFYPDSVRRAMHQYVVQYNILCKVYFVALLANLSIIFYFVVFGFGSGFAFTCDSDFCRCRMCRHLPVSPRIYAF